MTTDERIHLLQSIAFFGAINDRSVALILELSETITLQPGEFFFHQDDHADALYILEKGEASIFKEFDNQEYLLRKISDGACFGDMALIDLSTRAGSVRAETECTAIKIPALALYSLYQQDPEQHLILQMNIAREMCRRLRASHDQCFQLQIDKKHRFR